MIIVRPNYGTCSGLLAAVGVLIMMSFICSDLMVII